MRRADAGVCTFFVVLCPPRASTIVCSLAPTFLPRIGRFVRSSSAGFQTMYSSGLTAPCTAFSPRPQTALMTTTSGKPLSVSSVKAMPAPPRSLRTMSCTPIDNATAR